MKPELNTVLSRILASLVVPGFIASGPFVLWIGEKYGSTRDWLLNGSVAPTAVAVMVVFTAALLMEEIGSWLEWFFWKGKKWQEGSKSLDRDNDWYSYLLTEKIPPPMTSHISHLVSRLKWELSGGSAFIVGSIPTLIFVRIWNLFSCSEYHVPKLWCVVLIFQWVIGGFLIRQGWKTMDYLMAIRYELAASLKAKQGDY